MNASATNLWADYRGAVYGGDLLPRDQERECSRAFYAGMQAAFREMLKISESVSDEELASERVQEFMESMVAAAKETLSS